MVLFLQVFFFFAFVGPRDCGRGIEAGDPAGGATFGEAPGFGAYGEGLDQGVFGEVVVGGVWEGMDETDGGEGDGGFGGCYRAGLGA